MLVPRNAKICVTLNANFSVTPNRKPQRESVENMLAWVPNAKFSRWPCKFPIFVCVDFILIGSRFSEEYGLYTLIFINISSK